MKYRNRAALLVALVTVYHLIVIGAVGPGDNESYYWTWAKHLDWSYFDHPPAVAWMIALTTGIGGDSVFFLRIGTVILFAFSCLFIYLLALEITESPKTAFFSVLLANVIPLYFLSGILTVPDAPLIFFWLIYLHLLFKLTQRVRRRHWFFMGIVLGLALLSKYFAVLLVPSTLLFLISDSRLRRYLRTPFPYATFLLAGFVASPILIWNVREDWASFVFQLSSRHEDGFVWRNVWNLIGGQMGVMTPLLFILLIWTLFIGIRRGYKSGDEDVRWKFLVFTSAPTLLFFFVVMALTSEAEPHWPGLGYLPLLIGAAWIYSQSLERKVSRSEGEREGGGLMCGALNAAKFGLSGLKTLAAFSLAIPLVVLLALNIQLLYPVYRPSLSPTDLGEDLTGWEVNRYDPISDLFGWGEIGTRIDQIRVEMSEEGSAPFVFSSHYNPASQLSFALKDSYGVYCLSEGIDQFDFWQATDSLIGRNAVYVITDRYFLPSFMSDSFYSIEGPEIMDIYRAGNYWVRRAYIYRCYGFRGME